VILLNWSAAGPTRAKARNGIICITIRSRAWLRVIFARRGVTGARVFVEKGRDAVVR
jgi:superfamily I DNA and RNA helicase